MAKRNEEKAVAEKDPAEPIGTPPRGGNWAWDSLNQAWLEIVEPTETQETPAAQ